MNSTEVAEYNSISTYSNKNDVADFKIVDRIIKLKIEKLTEENSSIWTSPEHNRREYVHSFFQYPAMMVPVVQKRIIDIIKSAKPSIKNVLDPFMGSATSLVACMENGLDCYGQDVNPLAILIGETRTGPYNVEELRDKQTNLFKHIDDDNSSDIEANFKGLNKWFKYEVSLELSKIVRAIRSEKNLDIRRFYWVNLAEVVRITSNDRTSTFKLHSRPKELIALRNCSPISEFKSHILNSTKDIELYRELLSQAGQLSGNFYSGKVHISLQDSSKGIVTPNRQIDFFDLLVTSPPYGDNKTTVTYGQHSYLPLQWLDLKDINDNANDGLLKTTLEIDTLSLGGKIKKLTDEQLNQLFEKSNSFQTTYNQLLNTTNERVNKVMVFIQDLYNVIEQIHAVMKPNSYQVWTIGNRTVGGIEIPNNKILIEFMSYKSCILVSQVEREIINKRMAKRNNGSQLMNVEDILIFRKIG